jgi:hypothetical protein
MKQPLKSVWAVGLAVVCAVFIAGCGTTQLGPVSVENVVMIGSEGAILTPKSNGFPSAAVQVKVDMEELANENPDIPFLDKIPIDEAWLILNADLAGVTNTPPSTNSVPVK